MGERGRERTPQFKGKERERKLGGSREEVEGKPGVMKSEEESGGGGRVMEAAGSPRGIEMGPPEGEPGRRMKRIGWVVLEEEKTGEEEW